MFGRPPRISISWLFLLINRLNFNKTTYERGNLYAKSSLKIISEFITYYKNQEYLRIFIFLEKEEELPPAITNDKVDTNYPSEMLYSKDRILFTRTAYIMSLRKRNSVIYLAK
jgi:hypothetical protein